MELTDFRAMRKIAIRNEHKTWYKQFCKVWDYEGANGAQKFLRTLPVYERLKEVAANWYPGKSGNTFSRHELYALREPRLKNVCACGNFVPYNSTTLTWMTGCCRKCAALSCVDMRASTCLQKYGESNPSRVDKFKKKRKQTTKKRFGVGNAFQSEKVKQQIRETNLRKYGVENPSQSAEIMERKKQTTLARHGVEHWTQDKRLYAEKGTPFDAKKIAKGRKTCLERYGTEFPSTLPQVQAKIRETNLKRYGVPNAGVLAKYKNYKTFVDKNDKVHVVVGYEHHALEFFNKKKSVLRLETRSRKLPKISYREGTKVRTYYPDLAAFTASSRVLVEVKSSYTLRQNTDNIIRKCRAATRFMQKRGWDFWLILVDDAFRIHVCKNPTQFEDLSKAFPKHL